jgi:Transposase zinc-binding domain
MCRRHGPESRATVGDRRRPRHQRALQDLARGRTKTLGGQVDHGETCRESPYSDHSCHNRHGPQGQPEQAAPWRDPQKHLLLPVPHGMVTLTRPAALRARARRHQKPLDHLRFRSASQA